MSAKPLVIACTKPTTLGEPQVAKGHLVLEGATWALAPGERRVLAAARIAADALRAELCAIAVAPAAAQVGLREALALGADRAIHVEAEPLDAVATARALAAAARKAGAPTLVLAGQASADAAQGLVGPMLAEALGLDLLAGVEGLRAEANVLHAVRRDGRDEERFRLAMPLAITVSPRFQPAGHATSWGVGKAYDAPLQRIPLADLRVEAKPLLEVVARGRPEAARIEAERFEGDADEAASQLARRLRAMGVGK
jgi:electron transfer flavoprotein beta subunit